MIRIFTLRSRFWISKHLLASETLIMLLGIDRMNLRDVIIWIFYHLYLFKSSFLMMRRSQPSKRTVNTLQNAVVSFPFAIFFFSFSCFCVCGFVKITPLETEQQKVVECRAAPSTQSRINPNWISTSLIRRGACWIMYHRVCVQKHLCVCVCVRQVSLLVSECVLFTPV